MTGDPYKGTYIKNRYRSGHICIATCLQLANYLMSFVTYKPPVFMKHVKYNICQLSRIAR